MLTPLLVAVALWTPPTPLPSPRAALRRVAPVMEQRDVSDILKELDNEVAALSEMRANERKTAQEKIASQTQQQPGRVTAFGARLDDDIAGEGVATAAREEEHAQLFEAGIKLMKRGEYKQAVTAFTRATAAAPGGLSDRKGGQYAIYLAEALQAAGRKKEAVGLLKRCEAHPDADVRKIADNVLYIMQAPELKLDADQFMSISGLPDAWDDKKPVRRAMEEKDPPPEKYSLEWYVLEGERNRKARELAAAREAESNQQQAVIAIAVAVIGVGALFETSG